ncbi:MAG: ParA family protein [Dehalococcoidia bacterium]
MQVWSVAAQKGGVGKTTTAVSMAGALACRGKTVLVVDLDPHASLTTYFRCEQAGAAATVYAWFEAVANGAQLTPEQQVSRTRHPGISVVPGSSAVFAIDRRFGTVPGMGLVLKRALPAFTNQYDFCVIDCPPTLGTAIVNAVAASDRMIVPIQTEYLAVRSLDSMLRTLSFIERRQGRIPPTLVVPTMYDCRTRASRDSLAQLQQHRGITLWSNVVPIDTKLRDAARTGLPLSLLEPASRGALAYDRLVGDLLSAEFPTVVRAIG